MNMWFIKSIITLYITSIVVILASPGDFVNVTIPNGPIFGVERVTSNQTKYWTFLGIPFAAPPVGKNRFRAPQPVQNWTKNRDATYERSNCTFTQKCKIWDKILKRRCNVNGSEDCLYLNIFTTQNPNNILKNLSVIVWIHGGAFIFGTGNTQLHKTEGFLDHDVLYVGINYRLGVFGFLSTEDDASPGNYGLKDQIAALKYIKENIHIFGGNPENITIFGESAGAVSVHYLLQSNLTRDLYRAAITDSGSTLCPWAVAQHPRRLAFRIGRRSGILAFTSKQLIKGLRTVNYKRLQQVASSYLLDTGNIWNGLPWAPCKEPNSQDAVVTNDSYELLSNGEFQRVPLLTGFNSNEARDTSHLVALGVNALSWKFTLFPGTLAPSDMHSTHPRTTGKNIKQFYFKNSAIKRDGKFENYATDNYFVRSIHKTVQLYSKYAPVYFYEFAFTGGAKHNGTSPGVGHAEELQFLFNYPQTSDSAILMQKQMLTMWTNFVRFMDPTPENQDEDVYVGKWENSTFNGTNNTAYYLINSSLAMNINPRNEAMQFWDSQYSKYGTQPFNNY